MLVKNNAITLKLTLQFNLRWLEPYLPKKGNTLDYIRPGN